MQYFKKINLECADQIKAFAINDTINQIQNKKWSLQLQVRHILPDGLRNIINYELNSKGIPDILYCQTYLREPNHIQGIHVDGDKELIKCAINIPLVGCAGSKYHWYSGKYMLGRVVKHGLIFHNVMWLENPIVDASIEFDGIYLVKVDAPHSAVAGPEERWVFTMRFNDNPSFDDLYNSL
jgi:hypothetical protein